MDGSRQVPAPALTETAEIWWDSTVVPLVVWDDEARRFWLVDGDDPARRLLLWRTDGHVEPRAVAEALAEGLAACDFPPTGDGAAPGRVEATLRAYGVGR